MEEARVPAPAERPRSLDECLAGRHRAPVPSCRCRDDRQRPAVDRAGPGPAHRPARAGPGPPPAATDATEGRAAQVVPGYRWLPEHLLVRRGACVRVSSARWSRIPRWPAWSDPVAWCGPSTWAATRRERSARPFDFRGRQDDWVPGDVRFFAARLRRASGTGEAEVLGTRLRAAQMVNTELIDLYWRVGQLILDRQQNQGWGTRVIDRLAADLRRSFRTLVGGAGRTCSRCAVSRRPGRGRQMSNRPLDDCPGDT